MASSKVMASSTSTNSDLARQASTYTLSIAELQSDQSKNYGSMSMDELIMNIYGDNPTAEIMPNAGGTSGVGEDGESKVGGLVSLSRQGSFSLPKGVGTKSVDDVWKEIAAANCDDGDRKVRDTGDKQFEEMTLEEFLAKTGTLREEDVKIPEMVGPVHGFVVDSALGGRLEQQQGEGSILWLGNGGEGRAGRRGKRRAVHEPLDKVAQQRQRRMIKNRESAARSRERKQAYTVELESLVTQLEEENAEMIRERAEKIKERYNKIIEYVFPVEEKRRPPRALRRVRSTHW